MKIGICDDDIQTRFFLKNCCEKSDDHDIFLFSSGEELFQFEDLKDLNLLFLDIEMPGMDGISIKNQFEHFFSNTYIIFCTTHTEVMSDAFGKNVLSFLTKPFSEQTVLDCIKKVAFLSKKFHPIHINESVFVPCKDILYLHSEQKYTLFYTCDRQKLYSHKSLSEWTKELVSFDFSSISRSCSINMNYFISIKGRDVLLEYGIKLPISRRYLSSFKKNYEEYLLHQIQY